MTSANGDRSAPQANSANSEAEFLNSQADETGRAIAHTLTAIKDSLHEAVDLKTWMKRYPWSTVGVAAGAGLILAAALGTRRRKAAAHENALLEKIVTDEQISQRLRELVAQDEKQQPDAGLTRSLVSSLLQTFGPAVQSAVTAAVAAKASAIFARDEAQQQADNVQDASGQDASGQNSNQQDCPPPATD